LHKQTTVLESTLGNSFTTDKIKTIIGENFDFHNY